jgi:ketosteroid isomerase-like protein
MTETSTASDEPDDDSTAALTGTGAEVFAVLTDLYAAFLAGDRDRVEAHLADGCTMWDSTLPGLRTKADLQASRSSAAAEPANATPAYPDPVALEAVDPAVGLLGPDAAWETHLLLARFDDPTLDEQLRCTSVLRRDDEGTWRVVHHHEELIIGPGRGLAVRTLASPS